MQQAARLGQQREAQRDRGERERAAAHERLPAAARRREISGQKQSANSAAVPLR